MLICVKTSPSVEVESNDKTLLIKSKTTEIDAFLLCGEVAFTNILPPHRKKAAFQECFQVQIGNNSMFGKYSGDMRKTDSVCAKEALSLNHIERGRDTLKEERASKSSEDIYNPMCSTPVWSLGDTVIKNAFISEEDDIAPIGKKHFLLETEDQDLDFIPSVFSYLETSENYSFSLDDGEGLTDLFDCNFSCP
ncbi:transcription factor E2F1 [Nephila pilipes]|uniref:Transcription factor E2F1 n=1 Tax=Nephila pilipes TaxID=299642 RepID=A0A8X6P278_NEPPI|nr:transcription factor E2F1 [Nephila pilipes]